MKYFVVTGGYGFIGSHFVNMLGNLIAEGEEIIVIDKLGVGSNPMNVVVPHHFHNVDLSNAEGYFKRLKDLHVGPIIAIIHFAAESHVDRSIADPSSFIKNNVNATLNVLNFIKDFSPDTTLINVSTDEVYGHLGTDDPPWTEDSPISPRSPYSASKAASDILVDSYRNTYGITAVTTRCSNNFGPNQGDEKFIPTIIRSIVEGKEIPVYGDGLNRREWIPVGMHCQQIYNLITRGSDSPVVNIVGGYEYSNIHLIREIERLMVEMHREEWLNTLYDVKYKFVEDRKGHDFRYALTSKFSNHCRGCTNYDFEAELKFTISHYVSLYEGRKERK